MKLPGIIFAFFVFASGWMAQGRAADVLPKEEIDALVKPVLDGHWAKGFVIGIVNEHGSQVAGYGIRSEQDPTAPDGNSIFEIGSISKTFTATLLAEAVLRGDVSLDDPAQKYLPAEVKMPVGKNAAPITLGQLSTHSSGLPRMPVNFAPADPANPFADYTVKQLYACLSTFKLPREPGEKSVYSNLGVALLGHILALRAHKQYEELLIENICRPMGMNSTRITLDDSMRKRVAPGFDGDGTPLKNWDLNTFAGAGGIRSTVDDMLRYVSAEAGLTKTGLDAAMELTQKTRGEMDANNKIGLGWMYRTAEGFYWHNGQTGGYHAFAGFNREKKIGVVVLCNTGGEIPDILGVALLRRLAGQKVGPPPLPQAVYVDPAILDRYVGEYRFNANETITIQRPGIHLTARINGQAAARIYPVSQIHFFWKVVNAQATFDVTPDGKVLGLVIRQNGKDTRAERVK